MLGYDTQSDPALKSMLERVAVAGGSGDEPHRPIEDEPSLIGALREIARAAVSWDRALAEAPADRPYALILLNGERLARAGRPPEKA